MKEVQRSSSWKPIKSAPKDGTKVLLCRNDSHWVEVGEWKKPNWATAGCTDACCVAQWIIWEWGDAWCGCSPTHWMPFPKPAKKHLDKTKKKK